MPPESGQRFRDEDMQRSRTYRCDPEGADFGQDDTANKDLGRSERTPLQFVPL
jgi:hypothetical protein